ncbi:MAG: MMPL family transporter [Planctomycetes bacterium]|nr:MMPL family transporter [Planctomycetota bacterium]
MDTDPENMLSADEPVRVFHRRMKKALSLYDMVVVGVVNEKDPDGVFNPRTLKRVYELTEFAATLTGAEIGAAVGRGVVPDDIIAPSTVDSMEPGEGGAVNFGWLMGEPPRTREQCLEVWRKAKRVPFLDGTLIGDVHPDRPSRAIALYLPLTDKNLSHEVYVKLRKRIASFGATGGDEFYITGLPVAEDTFGVEMFIQMAISAPMAMALVFLLMLLFFRKLVLIIAPMIVAIISVIFTMGALIITGYPIHIMSSMIPIFIMPIAVLNSIHIISEFFEKYQATRDRARTIKAVMDELFMPMLYTSLTTAAGFASLALTPIPPVQVFGIFVSVGIMVAWILTMMFIPAYVMLLSPRTLENFGAGHRDETSQKAASLSLLAKAMAATERVTYRFAKAIVVVAMIVLVAAGFGLSMIDVNDNPVKWFDKSHPIRKADMVLNRHFGGTYMAYLAFAADESDFDAARFGAELAEQARKRASELKDDYPDAEKVFAELGDLARGIEATGWSEFFEHLAAAVDKARGAGEAAPSQESPGGDVPGLPGGLDEAGEPQFHIDETADIASGEKEAWEQATDFIEEQRMRGELFKRPDVLDYLARLQDHLTKMELVGKINSLSDIVRTVYRDLRLPVADKDDPAKLAEFYKLPATRAGVAETLIQFQQSHRYRDLFHFVTPDFRSTSMWIQLKSGDNRDMSLVIEETKKFVKAQRPPSGVGTPEWFGLTYINVVWQNKMTTGMLSAFAGSFLVVLLLMITLFRSALWGLLSMVPLTVTIVGIYGVIGVAGKDYDMPVAILSSLTLGLAVDFAIHFLARSRTIYARCGSWRATAPAVFGEPARAIMRNIIVIAGGFLPLLLAPLVPYQTVGILLATILLVSGLATLVLLPAMVRLLEKRLFRPSRPVGAACNCAACLIGSTAMVMVIVLSLQSYVSATWTTLTGFGGATVVLAAVSCGILSRRAKCRIQADTEETQE